MTRRTLALAVAAVSVSGGTPGGTYDATTGEGPHVPPGWTGKMPNGDQIGQSSTFLSMRSMFRDDPRWPKVQSCLDGGPAPTSSYHRFWAQAEIATAFSLHTELFG